MPPDEKLLERWRYLRELLVQQLDALEAGLMQIRTAGADASTGAIEKLKWEIADFDALIAEATRRGL